MSATTQPETAECSYCDGDRDPYASVAGSFCSTECHTKHRADKALNVVRNDHRICASCLRFVKTVESPDDEWVNEHKSRSQFALRVGGLFHNKCGESVLDLTHCPDEQRTQRESIRGYQYRTENAETAVIEVEGPHKWSRVKQTGTSCRCGNTDPSETIDILQECEPAVVLANHVNTFRRLEAEGKIDKRINKDVLFETFRETRDLMLALGRALHE